MCICTHATNVYVYSQEEASSIKRELEGVRTELFQAKKRLTELEIANKNKDDDVKQATAELRQQISDMQKELEWAMKETNGLSKQLEKARAQVEIQQRELDEATASAMESEAVAEALRAQIQVLGKSTGYQVTVSTSTKVCDQKVVTSTASKRTDIGTVKKNGSGAERELVQAHAAMDTNDEMMDVAGAGLNKGWKVLPPSPIAPSTELSTAATYNEVSMDASTDVGHSGNVLAGFGANVERVGADVMEGSDVCAGVASGSEDDEYDDDGAHASAVGAQSRGGGVNAGKHVCVYSYDHVCVCWFM
jgi:hypothetical protein